jgi:hypothetical protein
MGMIFLYKKIMQKLLLSSFFIFVLLLVTVAQNIGISDQLFTPQSPLHIYRTTDGNMLQISNSTITNSGFQIHMSGNDYSLINRQTGFMSFSTNNSERIRITSSGNVGIGTSTPTALLHTNGIGTGGGNVLFVGAYKATPGDPPASGAGTRMMWYPDKSAFRVGGVLGTNWDKDSIGIYSVAMGYNTKAKGAVSTAMGFATTASGSSSTAMGYNTIASGEYSTTMGYFTNASGSFSTAMGYNTIASGEYSTTMGYFTNASGSFSTAMGYNTLASGYLSTAMGRETNASGNYSTAMGLYSTALSYVETVVGNWNTNYTPNSSTAWNTNDRLFVIGNGTGSTTRSDAMVVLKNGNTGIGTSTPTALLHTNGIGTGGGNVLFVGTHKATPGDPPASGAGTRMMWYPDKSAFRVGRVTGTHWDKDSIGNYSVAMGYNTKAKGAVSTAMGFATTASGYSSTAMGYFTNASGYSSTAMGIYTTASGYSSTAMGYYSTASGDYSTSIGLFTTASGYNSTAMGRETNASGNYSTAMGYLTTASGSSSTAMGYLTNASGFYSTAMGRNAHATGDYSFAINLSTTAGPSVGANTFRISGATSIGGNLVWTNHSDKRLKKNIELLSAENNIGKIMQLNGVRYEWKEYNDNLNLGFIAQDVVDILPEAVRYDADNDIYSMEYTAIIPVLVEGMKEQQNIIENQNAQIKVLQTQNKSLQLDIETLKQMVELQQIQISALLQMNSSGSESVSK